MSSNELNDNEVIKGYDEDQKNYLNFFLRQIELDTDFAKWFKGFRRMNGLQKSVFNKKVSEAIKKKDANA